MLSSVCDKEGSVKFRLTLGRERGHGQMTRNVDVLRLGPKPLERLAPREALCGLFCRWEFVWNADGAGGGC